MRKPMIPTTAPNNNSSSGSSSSSSRRRSMPKPTPCCSKVGLKRGPWTPEEDRILSEYLRKEGEGRWTTLPKRAGLVRCGKSCRLRWMNYLRPSIKHGDIAPDEEDLIIRLHRLLGNRWSLIAGRIPGRTDNEIKNYWNTHLSKKLISQGIDPRTHKPLMTSTNPNLKPAPQYNHNFQIPSALPAAPHSNAPNSISLFAEKMNATGNSIIPNNDYCVNDYFCGTNIDHEQGWQNSADMLLDGNDNSGGGDVGIDCSNDDDFSSFLDSLFDVDMFSQQERQHLQQQQQINGFGSDVNDKDDNVNLIMTTSAGFGVSSIQGDSISSADALNEDVNRQFV